MIDIANIRSLSEFQRNARSHIKRLKKTGKPEVLTVNGQAELVVQSADSYQHLLEQLRQLDTLKAIQRGLDQARAGQGRPMRTFLEELAAEHGIELRK